MPYHSLFFGLHMLKEHDCVVLMEDLPTEGLKAGDIGTLVHIHKGGDSCEVEFMTLTGETIVVTTLSAVQVRPADRLDMAHARELSQDRGEEEVSRAMKNAQRRTVPEPFLTTQYGALFSSDCLAILQELKSETVDCVFADPPFNLGKDYKNGFKDKKSEADYYEWCTQWINECSRVLKPGGAFFVYALPEIAVRFAGFMRERLTFRHWIAITMKGSYSRGKKLYPAHYALLYFTRGDPKTFNRVRLPIPLCRHCDGEVKDYGGHRDKLNPEGLNLTDFWDDTSPNRHKKFKVRPGVNELKLVVPERAILISTNEGDLVLDPFGGGGSTYQAAEKHRRQWLGIEMYDCLYIDQRMRERFPVSIRKETSINLVELFKQNENNADQILRRSKR